MDSPTFHFKQIKGIYQLKPFAFSYWNSSFIFHSFMKNKIYQIQFYNYSSFNTKSKFFYSIYFSISKIIFHGMYYVCNIHMYDVDISILY